MTHLLYTLLLIFSFAGLSPALGQMPAPPDSVWAIPYECHIEIQWVASTTTTATGYQIWRSVDGQNFELIKTVNATQRRLADWICDEGPAGQVRFYKIKTVANTNVGDFSEVVNTQTLSLSDDQFLEMVQEYTFRYFWDHGHPYSGMARERLNSGNTVTTGGTGFGIMAMIVAAERGWITREAAVDRLVLITSFLQGADRFHGVFPHWMHGQTGNVQPFSTFDNGGDLVETAFLMQGLLAARQYFDRDEPLETALRSIITGLWEDVEWNWYRRNNSPVLYWHWSPQYQWQMNFPLRGFNEAHIVYILAIASPTYGVPASLYHSGWAGSNYTSPFTYFGYPLFTSPPGGGPLFFAHYSYLGFDPRNKKDAYANYFIRNRNHSLVQVAYSIANPENHQHYSAECWGLTASDDPWGYLAHDIGANNDNGTISPTAALSSMPYTPTQSLAALKHFYREHGSRLWGDYGFFDAFNLDQNWFASSYLAIDQGPIVGMIENFRTGLLWDMFMKNPEIQPALDAIGFVPDSTTAVHRPTIAEKAWDIQIFPQPTQSGQKINLQIQMPESAELTIDLCDAAGRTVSNLLPGQFYEAGTQNLTLLCPNLPLGTYWLTLNIKNNKNIHKTQTTPLLLTTP